MKKKRVLLIAVILLIVCLAGCGNVKEEMATPQITESETDNREDKTEEKATLIPTPEPTPEPTPTVEEMYEKEYEYLLHGKINYLKNREKDVLGGFNCPYRLLDHADWDDGENYLFRNDYDLNYLCVHSVEEGSFRITEEGNIVSMRNQNKIWGIVDEETEVDTANGTVKIYFSKELQYINGYDRHAGEIAQFNMGDGIITVSYSYSYRYDKSNQNKLEKLLPVLLTPVMAENQTMEVAQNSISVGDGYELNLCDPKIGGDDYGNYMQKETMLPVLGVNLAVWESPFSCVYYNGVVDSRIENSLAYTYATGCAIVKYKAGSMVESLDSLAEFITIDVDNGHIYNYFFGGRSLFKTEEKAEIETPFGIAKIFFAVKEDVEESLEEEVAILNNMGNNVIISYYGTTNPYDGIYDGKLEELIPKLFE